MNDLNQELWKLGILATTEHNEVAPAQHELAPIFTKWNIAVDQNQLTMETMKRVAAKHGLVCLLHEKPFEGVNGSGKHNNWSMGTDTGDNLLYPGDTPHENAQFLLFLCAVIKAVDEYQDLLRNAPWLPATTTASAPTRPRRPSSPCSWATMRSPPCWMPSNADAPYQGLRTPHEAGSSGACPGSPGHHGPQPDLPLRLHRQQVRVPSYETDLVRRLSGLTDCIAQRTENLEHLMAQLQTTEDVTATACRIRDEILPAMSALRAAADEAETITASDCWPYPTYGDLLFSVR